jgi:uracil-DNA glycosylase
MPAHAFKSAPSSVFPALPQDWFAAIGAEFSRPYMASLEQFLTQEIGTQKQIFPPAPDMFAAFAKTPLSAVRVVILGQDPYHGPGQAHGLSFSVREGVKLPPSLRNIYKEIEREYGEPIPANGDLTRWAEQGVLLLNATLSVRASEAGSHQKQGWENFTDAAIRAVSDKKDPVVFMLWGSYAQKKGECIDRTRHLILEAPHPSPLSAHRGFIGCGHFRKANDFLATNGIKPINWLADA